MQGQEEVESEETLQGSELFDRVKAKLQDVDIPKLMRKSPYVALGVAAAVGVGFGMFVGSKILRSLVLSVGVSVVAEELKRYGRRMLEDMDGDPTTH